MDPVHSGTGVFYQAMPAIGANGKNVMKLIPVQMVNGRFVQTQISKPKTRPAPFEEVTFSAASAPVEIPRKDPFNQTSSQQFIKKQVSLLNALPNQVALALSNSANQQQTKVTPQVVAPSTNLEKMVKLPFQLPVMVKSPVLPKGQCLQIPPTAQVQRVPASQLPPRVKDQIFTSSTDSLANSGSNSVVYVSPVTTVNQGPGEASSSASQTLKLLSQAASPRAAKPHLKLIPKVSQRPNSPIRWVIEETESSAAQKYPLSSAVTSEIIQSVSERENKSRKQVFPSGQRTDVQGQENALVVCNGKVFFVANKGSSSFQSTVTAQSTVPPPPPLPHQPHEPATPKKNPVLRPPGESSEVIDLCDDDDDDDDQQALTQQPSTSCTSHPDEDNVIFVSYIPPKSETMSKPQAGIVKDTNRTTSSGSISTADAQREDPDRNITFTQSTQSSTQLLGNMQSSADHNNPGEHPLTEGSTETKENSNHAVPEWTSPLVPELCEMSDSLLRKMFGITADVKISLQKIDEASPDLHRESIGSEEEAKPKSSLKEKELISQDVLCPEDMVQTPKTLREHELLASLHARTIPFKSSHFQLNSEAPSAWTESCCLGQSSHSTPCHANPQPVLGYVEPIDEDFPDVNDMSKSQSSPTHPQMCANMNTNTRRLGRTRKRTMCPCCIPTALLPAVKSSIRLEEPNTPTSEQTSRKTGRTKAPRQDGKTSGRISCLEAKSKVHEALNTCQLKRHENTERLKHLLNEEGAIKDGIS